MKRAMIFLVALSGLMMSGVVLAEGSVARAIVTTAVSEREPVNDLDQVMAGNDKVIFFTELRGMEGQAVKHRWSHGDESLAEVEFNVGGPRWRVWSSKNLLPEWSGEWKVEVIDGEGNVVSEKLFGFGAAAKAAVAEVDSAVEATSEALGDAPAAETVTEALGDAPAAAIGDASK